MKLHLIRHAKTNQYSNTGSDFDRQLLDRGWRQCSELADFLAKIDLANATIFCSSATRTRETLKGLGSILPTENTVFEKALYLCSTKEYLQFICSHTSASDLVFIGHNFGISDLLNYFVDSDHEMQTAEYVCIEFAIDKWQEAFQGTGILCDRFRPKSH